MHTVAESTLNTLVNQNQNKNDKKLNLRRGVGVARRREAITQAQYAKEQEVIRKKT